MPPKKNSNALRLLIVDDEENIRRTVAIVFEALGHETVGAGDGAAALKQLERGHFDLAFLDLKLGSESGMDLLREMLKIEPRLAIVVFTAYASIETAVEAMRRGAMDYLAKPFTPGQIRQALAKILEARQLRERVAELEARLSTTAPAPHLGTSEPAMEKALALAFKAAATSATILLLGESGTGKTVLARTIHANSARKDCPFVTVSCPSLSPELLESELFGHARGAFTGAFADKLGKVAVADNGTLFLDEIGELPLSIQAKLLRLLQEKEYERVGDNRTHRAYVRVIAATNRNLEQAVQARRFREDLYYRLNVIAIHLPPLRERPRDLEGIAQGYLQFFSRQCVKRLRGFSPEALSALGSYAWPGNLRELRNVVERAVILAGTDVIDLPDLPEKIAGDQGHQPARGIHVGARVSLEELENEHLLRVIQQTATMDEAAHILGIDPATLYRKRKRMLLDDRRLPPGRVTGHS